MAITPCWERYSSKLFSSGTEGQDRGAAKASGAWPRNHELSLDISVLGPRNQLGETHLPGGALLGQAALALPRLQDAPPSRVTERTQTHAFSAHFQCSLHCTTHRGGETTWPDAPLTPSWFSNLAGVSHRQEAIAGALHTKRHPARPFPSLASPLALSNLTPHTR